MILVADVDKIKTNLKPLSKEIESFTESVSKFSNENLECPLEDVSGVLESYKSSIADDLSKLNTSSTEYKELVKDCYTEYKENEKNVKTIDIEQIQEIILNNKEVTIEYEGSAAEQLTGLPSTELSSISIIEAKRIVEKYNGCDIEALSNKEFLEYIAAAAQIDYVESGILPSVTIAQAICESGWGNSSIGNNIFGIKCGSGWKGKRVNCRTKEQSSGGSYYSINADFRDYDSIVEGIGDHSDLLNSDWYAPVRKACDNNDAYEACRQLKKCGYATSHSYANTLITIIKENDLKQYDPKK